MQLIQLKPPSFCVLARQEPFYVWFHTDADELTNGAGGDAASNELVGFPPGR